MVDNGCLRAIRGDRLYPSSRLFNNTRIVPIRLGRKANY